MFQKLKKVNNYLRNSWCVLQLWIWLDWPIPWLCFWNIPLRLLLWMNLSQLESAEECLSLLSYFTSVILILLTIFAMPSENKCYHFLLTFSSLLLLFQQLSSFSCFLIFLGLQWYLFLSFSFTFWRIDHTNKPKKTIELHFLFW